MTDVLNRLNQVIDEQHAEKPAATRRQLVAGAAATLGGLGVLGLPGLAQAGHQEGHISLDNIPKSDPQTILNIAATAEVLATIVNTVGVERVALPDDGATKIAASARHELIHYNTLVQLGAKPLTKRIYVPDAVFANATSFLSTVEVGDQIFINAYLIAVTEFGRRGNGKLARVAAEFMGVEAVHRAFARDLRGLLGNDRAYTKFDQDERAPGAPTPPKRGFERIETAVQQLQGAGFGFGAKGSVTPGTFYDFGVVSRRTPNPADVNNRAID